MLKFFQNEIKNTIFAADMEKTLVIIKPGAIQRQIAGEIITRFERKGLRLLAMKLIHLSDEVLNDHYSHLKDKPFFPALKSMMLSAPVIVCCWEGIDAVAVVRKMTGVTNSRNAEPGTIRGDFSMSGSQNVIHASDSVENAVIELNRFFKPNEYCAYTKADYQNSYANDELE